MIEVRLVENKYIIDFGGAKFREHLDEVRTSFHKRKFEEKTKNWSAPICPRNNFLFALHNGKNPYKRYDTVITQKEVDEARQTIVDSKLLSTDTIEYIDKKKKFQWIFLAYLFKIGVHLIAAEMRMGKTLPVLLYLSLKRFNTWYVTSKSAKLGLPVEIKKWNLPVASIMIPMTYDKFTSLMQEDADVPQCIVYDEIHMLKDTKTLRWQAASMATQKQIEKYGESRITIGLSGTPAPKDQSEWFAVSEVLEPGFLKEGSQIELKKRLCYLEFMEGQYGGKYPVMDKTQGKEGWKVEEIENLGKRLQGLVSTYRNVDWQVDYTPPVRVVKKAKISKEVKAAIRLVSKLKTGLDLYSTLRQLSDGFQYQYSDIDPVTLKKERLATEIFETGKDELFLNELQLHTECGRLVAYAAFTESVKKLVDIAVSAGWEVLCITGKGLKSYNSLEEPQDLLRMMDASFEESNAPSDAERKIVTICQSDCGTTGMEFSASPTIVYYSNTNNFANKKQSGARIDSMNSKFLEKQLVELVYLSIDELVLDRYLTDEEFHEIPHNVLIEAMKRDLESED